MPPLIRRVLTLSAVSCFAIFVLVLGAVALKSLLLLLLVPVGMFGPIVMVQRRIPVRAGAWLRFGPTGRHLLRIAWGGKTNEDPFETTPKQALELLGRYYPKLVAAQIHDSPFPTETDIPLYPGVEPQEKVYFPLAALVRGDAVACRHLTNAFLAELDHLFKWRTDEALGLAVEFQRLLPPQEQLRVRRQAVRISLQTTYPVPSVQARALALQQCYVPELADELSTALTTAITFDKEFFTALDHAHIPGLAQALAEIPMGPMTYMHADEFMYVLWNQDPNACVHWVLKCIRSNYALAQSLLERLASRAKRAEISGWSEQTLDTLRNFYLESPVPLREDDRRALESIIKQSDPEMVELSAAMRRGRTS